MNSSPQILLWPTNSCCFSSALYNRHSISRPILFHLVIAVVMLQKRHLFRLRLLPLPPCPFPYLSVKVCCMYPSLFLSNTPFISTNFTAPHTVCIPLCLIPHLFYKSHDYSIKIGLCNLKFCLLWFKGKKDCEHCRAAREMYPSLSIGTKLHWPLHIAIWLSRCPCNFPLYDSSMHALLYFPCWCSVLKSAAKNILVCLISSTHFCLLPIS